MIFPTHPSSSANLTHASSATHCLTGPLAVVTEMFPCLVSTLIVQPSCFGSRIRCTVTFVTAFAAMSVAIDRLSIGVVMLCLTKVLFC